MLKCGLGILAVLFADGAGWGACNAFCTGDRSRGRLIGSPKGRRQTKYQDKGPRLDHRSDCIWEWNESSRDSCGACTFGCPDYGDRRASQVAMMASGARGARSSAL